MRRPSRDPPSLYSSRICSSPMRRTHPAALHRPAPCPNAPPTAFPGRLPRRRPPAPALAGRPRPRARARTLLSRPRPRFQLHPRHGRLRRSVCRASGPAVPAPAAPTLPAAFAQPPAASALARATLGRLRLPVLLTRLPGSPRSSSSAGRLRGCPRLCTGPAPAPVLPRLRPSLAGLARAAVSRALGRLLPRMRPCSRCLPGRPRPVSVLAAVFLFLFSFFFSFY